MCVCVHMCKEREGEEEAGERKRINTKRRKRKQHGESRKRTDKDRRMLKRNCSSLSYLKGMQPGNEAATE